MTYFWLCLFFLAATSFASRGLFIILSNRISLAPSIQDALKYLAPSIFAAIIAPAVLNYRGSPDFSLGNLQLWAIVPAAIVAFKTKSIVFTLATGLLGLALLEYLF